MRIHARRFLLFNSLMVLEEVVRMSQPFIISALLQYFQGEADLSHALEYGALLCLGVIINATIHHPLFLANNLIGLKLRLACSGLIYKKIFKYNFCGKENEASGRIMNLITNDCGRLELVTLFLGYLIIGPLEALFVIYVLVQIVDVHFLTGLGVMCVFVPSQSIVSKMIDHMRCFDTYA